MITPKQVLEKFYAAERLIMDGKADFEAMAGTLAEDVVLHQSPDLPFGGEYAGIPRYKDWANAMGAIFDTVDVQDARYFEEGDTVLVLCTLVTRTRGSGETLRYPMVQEVRVKNGKIVEFRPFYWNVPAYVEAARKAGRRVT